MATGQLNKAVTVRSIQMVQDSCLCFALRFLLLSRMLVIRLRGCLAAVAGYDRGAAPDRAVRAAVRLRAIARLPRRARARRQLQRDERLHARRQDPRPNRATDADLHPVIHRGGKDTPDGGGFKRGATIQSFE